MKTIPIQTVKSGISITTMQNWWTNYGKGRGTFNVSLYLRIQAIKESTENSNDTKEDTTELHKD